MARIAGVNLPDSKHAEISLMYIYGVGRSLAQKILTKVGIAWNKKMGELSEAELDLIREELKHYIIEGDLRREVAGNIKRLQISVHIADLVTRSVSQFVVNEPRPMLVLVRVRRLQSMNKKK
jgi:ribosomal protein uS13